MSATTISSLLGSLWNSALLLEKSGERDNNFHKMNYKAMQDFQQLPASNPNTKAVWDLYNMEHHTREETLMMRNAVAQLIQTVFEILLSQKVLVSSSPPICSSSSSCNNNSTCTAAETAANVAPDAAPPQVQVGEKRKPLLSSSASAIRKRERREAEKKKKSENTFVILQDPFM